MAAKRSPKNKPRAGRPTAREPGAEAGGAGTASPPGPSAKGGEARAEAGSDERSATRGAGSARTAAAARWLSGPGVAALVAACTLIVYLFTLAPTVTTEDSGELVTAAVRWGVAHPPGYPLYCLLLQPFVRAPFWSPAFGANLASAVFGALAAGGVTLVGQRLGAPARYAAAGGLLFAFARDVWAQAVIAEVYTLNALLLLAIMLLVLRLAAEKRGRDLLLAAGLFGLSLSNHSPLMLLAFPAIAVFVARTARGVLQDRRLWPAAAGLSLLGLAPYLYLPLAASARPVLNWGDPSTPERFWAHVSRAAYRKLEVGHVSSATDKVRFLSLFFDILASQWTTPVLLALGVLGLLKLRRRPKERDLLLGVAALSGIGLTLILNYAYEHENIQRVDEFYLPVYAALAPILGLGLAQAGDEIARLAPAAARAASVVLPAAPLFPLIWHFHHNDLSDDRLAHRYNSLALDSLPRDSVYFTSGDYSSFPCLYLQAVEGRRPDVILADVTGDLSPSARAYLAEIDPSVDPADRAAVQAAFLEKGHREVLVASRSDLKVEARVDPWGPVYFVWGKPRGPVGSRGPGERPPSIEAFDLPLPERVPGADGLLRTLLADYHLMRGEALFARGDSDGALSEFRLAVASQPDSKETVNNVASTAAERRFFADAERWFARAAALSPTYATPRRNLARLLDGAGKRQEAIEAYRELLRAAPDDTGARERLDVLLQARDAPPPARPADRRVDDLLAAIQREPDEPALYNNLGNVYAESGDARRAREAYEKALQLNPRYALAYKNLGILHRDLLKDTAAAERYFERYRSLEGK